MEGLIEGRIIHYVAYNQRHLASLVSGVNETKIDLAVFTNMSDVNGIKNFSLQFHQDVEFSQEIKPGTCHWIEKA